MRAARGLACVAVIASLAMAVPPPVSAAESTRTSLSFIEALAAIPAATKAVQAARDVLSQARASHAVVASAEEQVRGEMDVATQARREAALVRTRADLAVVRAREGVADAARALYTSGGGVPSLAEVLLTADTPRGFTRSLVTRQYLSAAATDVLRRAEASGAAAMAAARIDGEARIRRDLAVDAFVAARAQRWEADAALADAQAKADAARAELKTLMRLTRVDRSDEYGKVKRCGDWLAKLLSRQGFEGENLREAWAIVMRESGGREDAVSVTNDLGLFQINTATWKSQPWFNRKMLLTRTYNAKVAHLLSDGGKSWYSWGLDGHGRPKPDAYVKVGWTPERIESSIVVPYIQWYANYPCRPADEPDLGLGLPVRPLADEGREDSALQEGGGVLAGTDTPVTSAQAADRDARRVLR